MDKKISVILEAALIFVLGILVAIFGAGTVLDNYFGVVCIVIGAFFAAVSILIIVKGQPLLPAFPITAGITLAIGIAMFTPWLTIANLINFMVIIVLGLGAGLVIYSIYSFTRGPAFRAFGAAQLCAGVLAIVLASCYVAFPGFQQAFWIIVGILMCLYAIAWLVFFFVVNGEHKHKKK